MIQRITSLTELNKALNQPTVSVALAPGFEDLNAAGFLADSRHVALKDGDAIAMFTCIEPGVFEAHYVFPPSVRGRDAFKAAKNILNVMFTIYHADIIVGHTPRDCLAARNLNHRLGFKKTGVSTDFFGRECVDIELRKDQWFLH